MDDLLDDLPSDVKAPPRNKFQPKAKARPKKGSVSVQPAKSVPVVSESDQLVQPNNIDSNSAEVKLISESTVTTQPESCVSKFSGDEHFQNADTSPGVKSVEDTIGQSAVADTSPAALDACTTQTEEDISAFPDVSFASTASVKPCSTQTDQAHSMSNIDLDTQHYNKETDYFSLEEADIASGKKAVKFQPKPKAQSSARKDSDHVPDAAEAPSENQQTKDYGPISIDDGEYYVDDIELSVSPTVPEESGDHGNKNTADAFNFSHESLDNELGSSGIEVDLNGNVYVDGEENGVQYHNDTYNEADVNRDESIEDDGLVDETTKKKRKQAKEIVPEKDKPTRRRRKVSKEPDESSEKPRKKFPHATRRKRTVNKALLEAAEDEIDLHKVPIRDLIILAEYKERQAKKDGATAQIPSTDTTRNDSTMNDDDPYDNDGTYGSDQDDGSFDNPNIERILTDARYFNYGSHMKRTRVKWSKQDTELFYQGIRQFGSDLSMIGQLFPDRNRRQIKLKFKSEERQHPQRLNDALSGRATDHSQFEFVIKNLQARASKEKAERYEMYGEDADLDEQREENEEPDEGAPEDHEMGGKSQQNEEPSTADQEHDEYQINPESEPEPEPEHEPDNSQVASPAKSNASEDDDDFDWNTYQSEL